MHTHTHTHTHTHRALPINKYTLQCYVVARKMWKTSENLANKKKFCEIFTCIEQLSF